MADQYVKSTANSAMIDYPLYLQPASGDSAFNYAGEDFRRLVTAIWPNEGVCDPTSFAVAQRGAGANFSVDITAGRGVITGDATSTQASFLFASTGTVNITTPSAPGSGTRTHRLVAQILDKQSAGTEYGWQFHLVEDTGSGLPALPASAIDLATISITAGQASVQNANITLTSSLANRWVNGLAGGGLIYTGYGTTTQNVAANTWTSINLQTDELDPFDMHTATNPSRVYIKVPGVYQLSGGVAWATLTSNTTRGDIPLGARFAKNGSAINGSVNVALNSNFGSDISVVPARTRTVQLARNDYVELQGRQQWTAAMDTQVAYADSYTTMELRYVG